jgi:hypothetical protein
MVLLVVATRVDWQNGHAFTAAGACSAVSRELAGRF